MKSVWAVLSIFLSLAVFILSPNSVKAECTPTINFGQTVSDTVSVAGETDTYTFCADAGDTVIVSMTISNGAAGTYEPDAYIRVYGPDGTKVCEAKAEQPSSSVKSINAEISGCVLTMSGAHTIQASEFGGNSTGSYNLLIQRLNNPGNITVISFGQTLSGSIESAGELDAWTFSAGAGDAAIVGLTIANNDAGTYEPDAYIRVYGPDGAKVCEAKAEQPQSSTKSINAEISSCALTLSGTYTIQVGEYGGNSAGTYNLSLNCASGSCGSPAVLPAPSNVSAGSGDGQAVISWTSYNGASSYNIYWSTTSGVTKTNGTKISNITGPSYTHTGLSNGTAYYYAVTAVNNAGESAASSEVYAIPPSLPPSKSVFENVLFQNGHYYALTKNAMTWNDAKTFAEQHGGYLAAINDDAENQILLSNYNSPIQTNYFWIGYNDIATEGSWIWANGEAAVYTKWWSQPGNNNTYNCTQFGYFSEGRWGDDACSKNYRAIVEWTTVAPIAPSNAKAMGWNGQTSVNWGASNGATAYNIYWSTTSGVTKVNGTKISNVTSPYKHTGLTNGTVYYYVVTAVNSVGESSESSEVSAVPTTVPPTYFTDNFESGLNNWLIGGQDWALTTSVFRSGSSSVTDSPSGNYQANAEAVLLLANPIDLSSSVSPILTFWYKSNLPDTGDHLYVEVSKDSGSTWTEIHNYYNQTMSTWAPAQFDLAGYKTSSVKIRLRLKTDSDITVGDGVYIDDLSVRENDMSTLSFPFSDNFEGGLDNWLVSGQDWALTTETFNNGSHSVTDSPAGSYPASAQAVMTLAYPVDLSSSVMPVLFFHHKSNIPDTGDHLYVEVSKDNGSTWTELSNIYNQNISSWPSVQLDLVNYKSAFVKIRFRVVTDSDTTVGDGVYIDDVAIKEKDTVIPTLTVTVRLSGAGTVTSSPTGINCGTDCTELYASGTSVTLTAAPASGYTFASWSECTSFSGNTCTVTMDKAKSVMAVFSDDSPQEAAYTTLSLDLSSSSILLNATTNATGKLTRLPETGADLSGLEVSLVITAPDGSSTTKTTTTYDSMGHYKFEGLSGFSQKGVYRLKASFEGTALLAKSEDETTLFVDASAGYAVIIEGSAPSGEGLQSYNKTANRIYGTLRERGFADSSIFYYNFNASQEGVDGAPSKSAIKTVIETTLKSRLNASPAPLYIIMLDHGSPDAFYLGKETIKSSDLNSWLNTLEGGLNAAALSEKRVVVIAMCYSGSFVPALSKDGRVIITSAAADESSYRGPKKEEDGLPSGDFFLDEIFRELKKGYSLKVAFEKATESTEERSPSGSKTNAVNPYLDDRSQHPHLDDTGDGKGSNVLYEDGDGNIADTLFLGSGLDNPVSAEIAEVTGTLYLDSGASSAVLWARTINDSQVSSAWIEIRAPSAGASADNILDLDMEEESLVYSETEKRWEKTYTAFVEPGMYEIFYYVQDKDSGEVSSLVRSVIYKSKSGNNGPSPFNLAAPADTSVTETIMKLDWEDSSDSDGDTVTYTVYISRDSSFSTVDYILQDVPYSETAIDMSAGLTDLTPYYWKVLAVDPYGAATESSQVWGFTTENSNGLPGLVYGHVTNADTGAPLKGATITCGTAGSVKSLPNGKYLMFVPAGQATCTAKADNYSEKTTDSIHVYPGDSIVKNIGLTPIGSSQFTLTINKSGTGKGTVMTTGINCGPDCTESYNSGATLILTASADQGSTFSLWQGCTEISGETCTVTVDRAKAVTAIFIVSSGTNLNENYTLTVIKTGSGTVTSVPSGIKCNSTAEADCENTYGKGKTIKLIAKADKGSKFMGWSGDCIGTKLTCRITAMGADKTVTATFGKPDISVSSGTIDLGSVAVKQTMTAPFAITNNGDAPLVINGLRSSGANAKMFKAVNSTTGRAITKEKLEAGDSLTITVKFRPTSAGSKTAALKIMSDDPDEGTVNVMLTGAGE